MTGLIIILSLILLVIVVLQMSRINELAKGIRGEEHEILSSSNRQGKYLLAFMVIFLVGTIVSAYYYKNYMLGYGPHVAASAHGPSIDTLFNVTLIITGIVFIITHVALFYFAYKYRYSPNRKASFISHDNKLEVIWTAIPAFTMFALVVQGLIVWNNVTADVDPDKEYMEIQTAGMQFQWVLRYPGPDGKLGATDFRKINSLNALGQDWKDVKNLDDFQPTDLVLPKGKQVKVRITARDVLHSFYLPHFRVKLDAIPGLPTFFVFTPTKTTEEYREELSKYREYQIPADPNEPDGPQKWEVFDYELACAELCGFGHYSMRKKVVVLEQAEYDQWEKEQKSFYMTSIRNSKDDPYTDQLFDFELELRRGDFDNALLRAMNELDETKKIVDLKYVSFVTGSAVLGSLSNYELDNAVAALKKMPELQIEIGGHTDNTGNAEANLALSQSRADVVAKYLRDAGIEESRYTTVGFGQEHPRDDNATEEGRANNRRTEFRITKQ